MNSSVNIVVKSKNWALSAHTNQHTLYNTEGSVLGWQRLVINAKNSAAIDAIANSLTCLLRQNDHITGVNLLQESEKKLALVFYRHHPLKKIHLDWVFSKKTKQSETPIFSVRLKPISDTKAWFFMLQHVAKRKKKLNGDKHLQIYRITRARQKRAGKAHALKKLVQEYQPLLSYQLVNCEPYQYWRLHREPELLKNASDGNASETLIRNYDESENIHNDHWYYWRSGHSRYAPKFEKCLAEFVQEHSDASIIYWDNDELDSEGMRVRPNFKPDWSPELLSSQNYIGSSYAVKGSLLKQLASIPADPYTRLLNLLTELSDPAHKVRHLPLILQHDNIQTESDKVAKEQAQALTQWLENQGDHVQRVESGVESGQFKPVFTIPEQPLVSVIIPTRNALDITRQCVNSVLKKTHYQNYEIIIVNNQSDEPETLQWFQEIAQHTKVRVLDYDHPFNYSAINNFAAKQSRGEHLCFLNNDTEVLNDTWLEEMLQQSARKAIGCVGAKLYYPDNTVQHAGVIMGLWGLAGHSHKNFMRHAPGYCNRLVSVQNYSAVTAACLLVKKAVFEKVRGFNENELTVAFNDVDLCLKVQELGLRNVWTPYAELYHYESKSRGKDDTPVKKQREEKEIRYMKERWASIIVHDPFYSPNLTRDLENFGIRMSSY